MKSLLRTLFIATLISNAMDAFTQTVYNVNQNKTISAAGIPSQCNKCVINIAEGVTLTIDKEIALQTTTFNGGNIQVNKKLTFWSPATFNNVTAIFANNAALVSSGALTISGSEFHFQGNATATFWATVTMSASKLVFVDNAGMESTAPFNLKDNSSLTAGDGTTASHAYIFFNGGNLNVYDNSYVSIAAYNNYYYNWSSYKSVTNNKTYTTTNNNLNCGSGKNPCSAQYLYGPATLNFAGITASAILPVKLSAFSVRANGAEVLINWTSDMELNSDRYEIERSFDGINWTRIASIQSQGTTNLVTKYSYTDHIKLQGNVSYRLRMVDKDESFAYSPVRSVRAAGAVTMNIFPNPATHYVVISTGDHKNKNVQLIAVNGQVVKQVNGTNNIQVPVNDVRDGNYFVRVTDTTGEAQVFKLIVKK